MFQGQTERFQAHLKWIQRKGEKDFNVAQNGCCMLICSKNKYDFMNPKQRYKGKSCLGKPTRTNQKSREQVRGQKKGKWISRENNLWQIHNLFV